MCGIAGVLTGPAAAPVTAEDLRRMISVLLHRGPDGYGLYRDGRVGLGNARLAIIDPEGGGQPIANEDGSVWLTFNGEIFNYVELRKELSNRGHRFRTTSDSEVIAHAYEEYGESAWSRFNGQFAIALWDRDRRLLWLVRDRFGIHPLHWTLSSRRLAFASEAKALFAGGFTEPRIDPAGLAQVFTRWSATSPHTLFERVHQVRPATALRFDEQLRCVERKYWEPLIPEGAEGGHVSADEAADELGHRLTEAVRLRLRADVPVGTYLSGGLDSSVISYLASALHGGGLRSFGIRFTEPAFDETDQQRDVASLLGVAHAETLCEADSIRSSLPDVVWHCETPLLRTAPVPLFLLSGLVRDAGMKVVLTGEGADELLAGYSIFKEDRIRRAWAKDPASKLRPGLLCRLHPEVGAEGARSTEQWRRFFGRDLTRTAHPFYSHIVRWTNTSWAARILSPQFRSALDLEAMNRDLEDQLPSEWRRWPPLARAQWIEIDTFMSSYLLSSQGDRMALGHGVEARYPFLDPGVVDFCLSLPSRLKLRGLADKLVLRRLAARWLPHNVAMRPKYPFRAPTTTALFGARWPEYATDLLSDRSMARLGLLDPEPSRRLIDRARRLEGHMAGEREEMALVGMLTLQLLGVAFLEEFPRWAGHAGERLERVPLVVSHDARGDARTVPGTD